MRVDASTADVSSVRADMLCCMMTRESGVPDAGGAADAVRQAAGDLGGRLAKTVTVANPAGNPPRILLAGLGSRSDMTRDTIRHVAGVAAQKAREMGVKHLAILCPPADVAPEVDSATQIVEGAVLALYNFDVYRAKKADAAPDTITVVSDTDVSRSVRTAAAVADGVLFARSVSNLPPNDCPPSALEAFAEEMARGGKVGCTVLSGSALKDGGFGGITAVGQGSANTPRLIILEYRGGSGKPVALVGKAVTFDTGGLSLKPGEKMDEMKFDKCGGCAVLGIIKAAADMDLPVNIVGVIPAAENMPGGGSYRPGDIIRLYNGKTAEILNTDAEGRLILADALAYVEEKFSPRAIIDFATLTGACVVALGYDVAGMISNDDGLAESVSASSERTAEGIWRLPLDGDYSDMIRSEVADVKNMGPARAAGTIVAAAFLQSAIKDTPWLHLDIAGTAWMRQASKKRSYNPSGATGFGVRLMLDYLRRI